MFYRYVLSPVLYSVFYDFTVHLLHSCKRVEVLAPFLSRSIHLNM